MASRQRVSAPADTPTSDRLQGQVIRQDLSGIPVAPAPRHEKPPPLYAALALGSLVLAGCTDGDDEQDLVNSDATISVSESLDPDLGYYLKAPLFDCQYYAVQQLSSTTSCDAAKVHWLRHGLRQGFQGSAEFSIRTYLAQASPLLVTFFGDNYRQAWHYYRHFGSVRPFKASTYAAPLR